MDKVYVSYRVDERLTIRGGYNREKKKKKDPSRFDMLPIRRQTWTQRNAPQICVVSAYHNVLDLGTMCWR